MDGPNPCLRDVVRRARFSFYRPLVELLEDRTLPSFLAATSYAVDSGPQSVVAADFNGDGIPDLAVANALSGTVSVLLGKGDGSFQAAHNNAVGSRPQSLAVGDF